MKKASKRGRPPLPEDERLGEVAKFRLSSEDRDLIDAAAAKLEKPFGAFVRDSALARARRVLSDDAKRKPSAGE